MKESSLGRLGAAFVLLGLWLIFPGGALANPYLPKPGEAPINVKVATCAVSGGFIHLYTAIDNGILAKYGIRAAHVYIRGSKISLAALSSDEVQFVYCAADATIPGMAAGIDAKLIGSPLVGLPYVLLARKDIKRVEELKGKAIGVTRAGDLSFRLSSMVLKKFNMSERDVNLRPIGGSQSERYNAMRQDIIQAILITPPLEVRGKKDGFNVIYKMKDMNLPFIYSSLHTNSKTLRERPLVVQRFIAAMAEAIHFAEKNPAKAKASVAKALKLKDEESLQSSYDAYTKEIVNRRLKVPPSSVAERVELAKEETKVRKKAEDIFDNSFAENLERSGFLKELWGGKLP